MAPEIVKAMKISGVEPQKDLLQLSNQFK